MSGESTESRALTPLWGLTIGAALGSGAAMATPGTGPVWLPPLLVVAGVISFVLATRRGQSAPAVLWLAAGFALVGGHAFHAAADRNRLAALLDPEDSVWIRARLVVTEGWSRGRWGWRTRVRVLEANHEKLQVPTLRRCRLEVRGTVRSQDLPQPGSVIDALVSIRGSPKSPLLVAPSGRLLETTGDFRPLSALRGRLAVGLLEAARFDVDRIRAAELAASLALGRRDLLPPGRREGWRDSGLAHVLAVSGLHVGLIAGMVWLFLALVEASPTTTRLVILLVLPTYAILAGGSPSAVRAALMGSIYLGARLLGRAVLPMAAVLLTAFLLLLTDPTLIAEVSFQLTVLLTAALVRWAPVASSAIPGPRWIAIAVAVPVIAQLAAAPLVAHHFSTLVPGAAAANLLVPWLLGPVVLASVAATAVAPFWSTAAGWLLEIVDLGSRLLWLAAAPGRISTLIPPAIPVPILACVLMMGVMALLPGRKGKTGALSYIAFTVVFAAWWWFIPPTTAATIELLPVSHGLALRVSDQNRHFLMDGGGARNEAAELMAPTRIHRLTAVIASHGDEDHIAGLTTVLRTSAVDALVLPFWMLESQDAVALIRAARRRDVRVIPVSRGSRLVFGDAVVEVVWPPGQAPPADENERSLVARLVLDRGTILLTADIGNAVERRLAVSTDLRCTTVIVPHHGSRHSASPEFLDATDARFALIPAGPNNLHNHPHPEVLERLDERGIDYRMPIRDGRCGVRWEDGEWRLYPADVSRE